MKSQRDFMTKHFDFMIKNWIRWPKKLERDRTMSLSLPRSTIMQFMVIYGGLSPSNVPIVVG